MNERAATHIGKRVAAERTDQGDMNIVLHTVLATNQPSTFDDDDGNDKKRARTHNTDHQVRMSQT